MYVFYTETEKCVRMKSVAGLSSRPLGLLSSFAFFVCRALGAYSSGRTVPLENLRLESSFAVV